MTSLGLGLAALGRPGYINVGHGRDLAGTGLGVAAMERQCHEVLDAAVALGIDYVDAARSYGRAEAFLSTWLTSRRRPVGHPMVGSKWGYTYTADWRVDAARHEVKDHTLATFRRQIRESAALLGDHLALYQVHSATIESGVLDDGAVLDALAELAELGPNGDGRGVAVGLTTTGPRQADTIRRALARRGPFTAVQATWNLHERSAEPALVEAHAAGWRVIVKEALANGRLARAPGDSEALAAALSRPWADVVLSGAATIAHLQSNAGAVALVDSVDRDLDRFDALIEPPEEYWSTRASLPWN